MLTGDGSEQVNTRNMSCSIAQEAISHTRNAWMQMDILETTFDELVFLWNLN